MAFHFWYAIATVVLRHKGLVKVFFLQFSQVFPYSSDFFNWPFFKNWTNEKSPITFLKRSFWSLENKSFALAIFFSTNSENYCKKILLVHCFYTTFFFLFWKSSWIKEVLYGEQRGFFCKFDSISKVVLSKESQIILRLFLVSSMYFQAI